MQLKVFMIAVLAVPTLFSSSAFFFFVFNQLYTGGLFHCYMLDESIFFHFRDARFILSLLFYF